MAAIIFLALGALMLYFAVEIGMRRRIAFLHDYHYPAFPKPAFL